MFTSNYCRIPQESIFHSRQKIQNIGMNEFEKCLQNQRTANLMRERGDLKGAVVDNILKRPDLGKVFMFSSL